MSGSAPSRPERRPSPRRRAPVASAGGAVFLLGLVVLSVVPRLPALANADYTLTADEAVDALVMRHLVRDGEITAFNWDTRYYGIVEGLLGLPWVLLFGWRAVAFKVGALSGLWLLAGSVFLLGRRLWGAAAGAWAALWILFVSAQFTAYWTLLAAGGYALVVAWGVVTLLVFDRWISPDESIRGAGRRRWAAFGALLGFGLYIYQLFAVFVLLFAAWWVAAAIAGRRGLARLLPAAAGGFIAGWAPQWLALVFGPAPGRAPTFELAGLERLADGVRLLVLDCAPALLGATYSGGEPLPGGWRGLGFLAAALPIAALMALAWSERRALRPPWDTRALLLLLVPLDLAVVLALGLPQDVNSSRYLLPALPSLALAGGWAIHRLGRGRGRGHGRAAALGMGALALLPSVTMVGHGVVASRFVGAGGIEVHREPLHDVIAALETRHIDAAYAPYWIAYKATFLAEERVIFDATDWSRYPPYGRRADAAQRAAWVFAVEMPGADEIRRRQAAEALARFERRLELGGIAAERIDVGPYRVFTGPGGRRLLPPPLRQRPRALRSPAAAIEILQTPARVAAGRAFLAAARFTNTSDGPWSVEGDHARAGSLRVNASYRWLDGEGRAVVEYGERSPLPFDLAPGESLETRVEVVAPAAPGVWRLRLTLVQEDVAWFDAATGSLAERPVLVEGG